MFTPAASAAAWAFPPRPRLFFREDDAGMMWCNGREFGNGCSKRRRDLQIIDAVGALVLGVFVLAVVFGVGALVREVHVAYSKNQYFPIYLSNSYEISYSNISTQGETTSAQNG